MATNDANHRKNIRVANPKLDSEAISAIYAPYVSNTIVSMEFVPPTAEEMSGRITTILEKFPWLVYEKNGVILGYAHGAPHRVRKGYQWSVETGIYLASAAQGQGIGKVLYKVVLEIVEKQGFHTALGIIALPNDVSIHLHQINGFEKVGIYKNIGFKLGKWLDTIIFQKSLRHYEETVEPPSPVPFAQINLELILSSRNKD